MKRSKLIALLSTVLALVMLLAGFAKPFVVMAEAEAAEAEEQQEEPAEGEDAEAPEEEAEEPAEEGEDAEAPEDAEEPAEDAEEAEEGEATEESAAPAEAEPRVNYDDPFVADREIVVHAYVDDIGDTWPKNFEETEVGKVLKERTGVTLKVNYQAADDDLEVLNQHIMSDSIDADVILSYLNNSARPEFPVLLKGAQEGLFADLSEILPNLLIYSRYMDQDYLPNDSYKNIVHRDEFDGAVYLLHLGIPRYDESMEFDPERDMLGGLYIQRAIAEALDIDPREIHTADQFYDLLVQIRDGGFEDANGQPVIPLGPKYWGGSVDSMDYYLRPMDWGVSEGFNMTEDGEVLHELETDYAKQKVDYTRKLLAEGLMHQEFFTMDATRAEEVCVSKSVGVIGDIHNYVDLIAKTEDWLPLGPLNDYKGNPADVASGKGGYGCMAVTADAENPEEIMKFFDYLATYDGHLLGEYGVEGVSYEMNEDGMPRLTAEAQQAVDDGDEEYMIEKIGAAFGGAGNYFFDYATTDFAMTQDFGETRPGAAGAEAFAGAIKVAEFAPKTFQYVPGLKAVAYLNDPEMEDIKSQMVLIDYREKLVQAFYAESDEDAYAILDNTLEQLEHAGLKEFEAHLKEIADADPEAINFY